MGAAGGKERDSAGRLVRLGREDLAEVLALERLCYTQPWTEANFIGEFQRPITVPLGFKKDGSLLAHCFFWLLPPEIHLLNLAVHPGHRRLSLGRRLMSAMIAIGRRAKVELVFLELRSSNLAAFDLYRSLGFVPGGRRAGYYEDGEDAILMTLDCGLSPVGH